jgi:hypothetical protein
MILRACQVYGIHISGELGTLKADRKHLALEESLSDETRLSLSSGEHVTGIRRRLLRTGVITHLALKSRAWSLNE